MMELEATPIPVDEAVEIMLADSAALDPNDALKRRIEEALELLERAKPRPLDD